jgi:leucyl-tRNA synthetase
MVLAPEHPLVPALTTPENRARVEEYVEQSRRLTEVQRLSTEKEKTGVRLGTHVVNRLNGERAPLLIADYVLASYGTGVVMGVPAHDQRDFEFAQKYGLLIKVVVAPPDWDGKPLEQAWTEPGTMVDSGPFDGAPSEEGKRKVTQYLEQQGWGKGTVTYRIRDWLISRQRYWGTPIPIIYCPTCGTVPVPEDQLPVVLPEDAEFRPTGESPLKYHDAFRKTACPQCGNEDAERETDTMDTFVDSSWYQFRYTSPEAGYDMPFDPEKVRAWCPVDLYTGGAEHAVMHLLYARFFTKALRDLGFVSFDEPFKKLFNQGIILGEDHEKMSKSRGNVVNPDDQVSMLGADAVRTFLMFVGPWEQGGSWSPLGIRGVSRWFNRVWDLMERRKEREDAPAPSAVADELRREVHRTIKKVSGDIESFNFNTAIAAMMTLTNTLSRLETDEAAVCSPEWRWAYDTLVLLLAPFAPHLAEEVWTSTGHPYSVHNQSWPEWDDELTKAEEITLVVQVDGKVRDRMTVAADVSEEAARQTALASERVQSALGGKTPARVIYVPGRLVNVVTR